MVWRCGEKMLKQRSRYSLSTMKKLYLITITILVSVAMLMTSCNREDINDDNGNTENPSDGSGDDSGSEDNPNYPSTAVVIPNAVTDYDGNSYDAVKIGNQVWMAKNLRTTHYADGTPIPGGSSGLVSYRLAPNNDEANVPEYGYLYSWSVAMKNAGSSDLNPSGVQGVCPNGWHLPSEAEWNQLETYMKSQSIYSQGGYSDYIAKALAATSGWDVSYEPNTPGYDPCSNNASGFSAVPAGTCYMGTTLGFGMNSVMWSATELPDNNDHSFGYAVVYAFQSPSRSTDNKQVTEAVRCVRN